MECKEECFMCAKTGSIKAYSVLEYRILFVLISISRAANKYFFLTGHMSDQFTILVGHKTIITTISGTSNFSLHFF